ncbi:MAG: mechanosensitive ion channel family protein [Rickettsiaceae bacterium]
MIFIFPIYYFIIKKLIFRFTRESVQKNNPRYNIILDRFKIFNHSLNCFICVYFVFWLNIFQDTKIVHKAFLRASDTILMTYLTVSISFFLIAVTNIISSVYRIKAKAQRVPISLHMQIVKVLIIIYAAGIIISSLFHLSITSLLTSLGAATALLTFIFKDAVLSLTAGLQVTLQDVVRIGDWIVIPKLGAEGVVEEISITVVKIRAFDNTVFTVPTYILITYNIKNWRGMSESGARRIKSSIYIDNQSICFCDKNLQNKLKKKIQYISEIIDNLNSKKIVITNITLFKEYLVMYLKNNESIYKEEFLCMVRDLDPNDYGALPVEIYCFVTTTVWLDYEAVKTEILNHAIAMVHEFNLKPFHISREVGNVVQLPNKVM